MKAFDYYNKCKWICPKCLQQQNGFIKKLATQYYLECLICEELVIDQNEIEDLLNITVGDIKAQN